MKKVVLVTTLFLAILFFIPKSALAQGSYNCRWTGNPQLAFRCVETNVACDDGFNAGNECRSHASSLDDCNSAGPFSCISTDACGQLGEDCCTTGNQCATGLICASGVCALNQSGQQDKSLLCPGQNAINTAIGCIPVGDTNAFISFLLRWAIGIAGGIAFLLIVVAGFQILSSQGDPKRLEAGKELLTAAIAGLLLLIFSVFILQLIGQNILGIL